jgi:hypothetical protein
MAKPRNTSRLESLKRRIVSTDGPTIDQLYGLEPVFEPSAAESGAALGEYAEFLCPYCCENIGTSIDMTGGARSFIEDCQVCCQPIEVSIQVGGRGELLGISAQRTD